MCDRHGRWKRAPGLLHWYSDQIPGWCVCSDFVEDRNGVFRRMYKAQYRGMSVGEVLPSAYPIRVMDALDDLLGHAFRSPRYFVTGKERGMDGDPVVLEPVS